MSSMPNEPTPSSESDELKHWRDKVEAQLRGMEHPAMEGVRAVLEERSRSLKDRLARLDCDEKTSASLRGAVAELDWLIHAARDAVEANLTVSGETGTNVAEGEYDFMPRDSEGLHASE